EEDFGILPRMNGRASRKHKNWMILTSLKRTQRFGSPEINFYERGDVVWCNARRNGIATARSWVKHIRTILPREQYQRLETIEFFRLRVLSPRELVDVVKQLRNLYSIPSKTALIGWDEVARRLAGLFGPQLVDRLQPNLLILHVGCVLSASD